MQQLSVCDGHFVGWGKGEPGEAAGEWKIGPGLSVTDLSLPHAGPGRSKSGSAEPSQVEIQECRAGSVCNRPLPPPPPTPSPTSQTDGVHYAPGSQ
jgi:hypothetical protein